jgi:hypothetical protein
MRNIQMGDSTGERIGKAAASGFRKGIRAKAIAPENQFTPWEFR